MSAAHDLPLISTIAVGFSSACLFGWIASKLRLSPIVGYLFAGIVIGPFTPGHIADTGIAEQLSELGILFLMFGVGLHFSLRDLMDVRKIALPGAIVQIAAATLLGVLLAWFWGWDIKAGLMLGLALSVASTVVLLRAMEEHHLLGTTNGNIAIGWLIVEDIVMVLALVLVPTLATLDLANDGMRGVSIDLATAIGKVALFVGFMLIAGRRILPWWLNVVSHARSRELFTLSVFAVAMGVAFGAAKLFGVSLALGAFFAGMMIRESDLSQEAADKALPLQDAFAVLFFVSVGMLVDPDIFIEKPLELLAVVAIIMVGKSIAAGAIVLLFRYPLKTALLVSAGLAQIGEFSFILASLGVANGLLPEEGRDLILGGALISISLNPVCFHVSRLIYEWVARHPKASALFKVPYDELASLINKSEPAQEKVILVGYGRVGQHVVSNMAELDMDLVIIDANRERVENLRRAGFEAFSGDATHHETLTYAGIEEAFALLVAVPNPYEVRHIVETARGIKPDVRILVRAQNDEEMQYFEKEKIELSVMGSFEVARRMVNHLKEKTLAGI